ncbi:MAG: aldose epimerase family protein [Akkermansiaceae bacterium]
METAPYGTTKDGQTVRLFTLTNSSGVEVQLCEYGAIVASVKTPDRNGKFANITLGKDSLEGWLENPDYLGATVGRYGNRIAKGTFSIDGKDYELATNNDPGGIPCHLHGGSKGFSHVLWNGQPVIRPKAIGVCFTYYSDSGEEGYPGNLTTHVTYWLTEDNELIFEATAKADAPTPVNLINHTYWNLSGKPSKTILDHELQLHAEQFLPTSAGLIPTGKKEPVQGSPMDFTKPTKIGKRIKDNFEHLKFGNGYDHCWVIREGEELSPAAVVHDPHSGRVLEVETNQPGVQFYSGNFLPHKYTGLCLETQAFPDSPNQPDFPDTILRPGETYTHTCVFKFSTR